MIDSGQAFAYFDKVHGPLYASSNGWFEGQCPYCGERKLTVNFDYLQVKCWKKCFDKTFIKYFIRDFEEVRYFEVDEILESYDSVPMDYSHLDRGRVEISDVSLPNGYTRVLIWNT